MISELLATLKRNWKRLVNGTPPLKRSVMSLKRPLTKPIMAHETSSPSPRPTTPASRSYTNPSLTNICTSCRRCMPTALAMPNSLRRSAASITKIMKTSRMPARIEKKAKSEKTLEKAVPPSSAAVKMVCLLKKSSGSSS